MTQNLRVTLLCGGVGGAKLALGLASILAPGNLTVIVNTADDFEHLGLSISPDIDTVLYTLAGIANPLTGWGRVDETWECMAALEQLGDETWFRLGDKDIATHLARTRLLREGFSLSEITCRFAKKLGVRSIILPMTDACVRTELETNRGLLSFQHYFVREQCAPKVRSVRFQGIERAEATSKVLASISDPSTDAIIFAPSNPFLSLDPILNVPGLRDALRMTRAPIVGVAPVIGQASFKGPTSKIMTEMGLCVGADEIASYYKDLLDIFIIDHADAGLEKRISQIGVKAECASIAMSDLEAKAMLALAVLNAAQRQLIHAQ